MGEFIQRLESLEVRGTAGDCRISSCTPIEHEDEITAWSRFTRAAGCLPEYQCPTTEAAVSLSQVRSRLAIDITAADSLAETAELWNWGNTRLPDERLVVAVYLWNYSRHLDVRGRISEALRYGTRAIEIRASVGRTGTTEELEQSRWLNLLAVTHGSAGNKLDAICCLLRSYAIRRRILPQDDPLLAQTLNNLANCLRAEANQNGAAMLLRAKAIWTNAGGAASSDAGWAIHNLGRALSIHGHHQAAAVLTDRALEIKSKSMGDTHPDTSTVMVNRGEQLHRVGDFQDADEYFVRAVAIRTHWFGRYAPVTMKTVSRWAASLMTSGQWGRAYRLLSESLPPVLQTWGYQDFRNVVQALVNCCQRLRFHSEAKKYKLLLEALQELFPNEFPACTISYQHIFACAAHWLNDSDLAAVEADVAALVRSDEDLIFGRHRLRKEVFLE